MVSVSQAYAEAGGANELFQAAGRATRSTWYWAHFTNLLVGHGTVIVFSAILYRFALVPRALAGLAVAAGVAGLVAVTMPLLGYRLVFPVLAAAGLGHLAVTLWLLARGFEERPHPFRGDAERVELTRSSTR